MTYEKIVAAVKKAVAKKDVSKVADMALSIYIYGEGEGEFYIAVKEGKLEIENFKYDDPEAYKLFPCENYNQVTIDVEEYRAKLNPQKAQPAQKTAGASANAAPKAAPKYEKKTFANAPSGRFVSASVGEATGFIPEKTDDAAKNKSNSDASSAPKKKFFGLF